jgi:IrrE N-terminal-like domain
MMTTLTPHDARKLIGCYKLPVPVRDLAVELGLQLLANPDLQRAAVSWPDRQLMRFRPAREEDMRVAIAHELGHLCDDHPGSGRFCSSLPWKSPDRFERTAHLWSEDYLMPPDLLRPWLVDLGSGMRLSRVARLCKVPVAFARRSLRRNGLLGLVWDDSLDAFRQAIA